MDCPLIAVVSFFFLSSSSCSDVWGVGEEYKVAWEKYEKTGPALKRTIEQVIGDVPEEERLTKKFRKLIEQEVKVDSKSLKASLAKT